MSLPNFVLVQGVVTGLGYGLLAMGLVLIYKTNRVLNFAQGQLGVVAAVFLVKCFYDFGFNYWFALALALGLAAAAGALCEVLLRRLADRPRVLVMVATIGLSQVLFVFTALPFIRPKNLYKPFPVPFDVSFHVGTFVFSPGEVSTAAKAESTPATVQATVDVRRVHTPDRRAESRFSAMARMARPQVDHLTRAAKPMATRGATTRVITSPGLNTKVPTWNDTSKGTGNGL